MQIWCDSDIWTWDKPDLQVLACRILSITHTLGHFYLLLQIKLILLYVPKDSVISSLKSNDLNLWVVVVYLHVVYLGMDC